MEKDVASLESHRSADEEQVFGNRRTAHLVPQPSEDASDPLNWPQWKKWFLFSIMNFATFTGICVATSPLLSSPAQAETYRTTPAVLAYTLSGTIGGLILGPLIFIPIARVVGMCSTTFWCLILTVAFSIWSGCADGPDDLISYAVSRGLVGMVCPVPQILTSGYIYNTFFLHERGKMYAIYSTTYTLATVVGATFCGFIIQHAPWPYNFWWLVGANGLAAVLVFCFMEETGYDRSLPPHVKATDRATLSREAGWVKSRIITFLPGNKCVPQQSFKTFTKVALAPFWIAIKPVTILASIYSMINFAWFVIISIEVAIFLQEPYKPPQFLGYGFSPQRTSFFYFSFWVGILLAQVYGVALSDKLPLAMARRSKDGWKPEFRLHVAWIPGLIVMPIGLGIFGAALKYHLHYMVLALGSFLISFGGVSSVPVSINYVVECFRKYPQEVSASLNASRLVLALVLPFFFDAWEARVGIDWVFGTAAFLSIFGFLLIAVLMLYGPALRRLTLSEEDEAGVAEEAAGMSK